MGDDDVAVLLVDFHSVVIGFSAHRHCLDHVVILIPHLDPEAIGAGAGLVAVLAGAGEPTPLRKHADVILGSIDEIGVSQRA